MADKRVYRLKVSGMVAFCDEDKEIEELLLGLRGAERFNKAVQELQEEAYELVVEMDRI